MNKVKLSPEELEQRRQQDWLADDESEQDAGGAPGVQEQMQELRDENNKDAKPAPSAPIPSPEDNAGKQQAAASNLAEQNGQEKPTPEQPGRTPEQARRYGVQPMNGKPPKGAPSAQRLNDVAWTTLAALQDAKAKDDFDALTTVVVQGLREVRAAAQAEGREDVLDALPSDQLLSEIEAAATNPKIRDRALVRAETEGFDVLAAILDRSDSNLAITQLVGELQKALDISDEELEVRKTIADFVNNTESFVAKYIARTDSGLSDRIRRHVETGGQE